MKTETIQDIARIVVSRALKVNPNDLISSTKIHDFPEWDSLGHLQIVQALEKKFKVTIDEEELFERLTRFDEIVAFVNRHVNKKGGNENG